MRITVHMPEDMIQMVKITAKNEGKSVSRLVSEAVQWYLKEKKRKRLGRMVLEMAGKIQIDRDVLKVLEEGRSDSRF